MRVEVSPELRRTVNDVGRPAERWLGDVPRLVARTAAAWNLEVAAQLGCHGSASVIFRVATPEGTPAVLKLSVPHDEARQEAEALRRWGGDGSVVLLRSSDDGLVLLVECCEPGQDLWQLPVDRQIQVVVDLLPRLWIVAEPGSGMPELADTVARWEPLMLDEARRIGVPAEVGRRARAWSRQLRDPQPRRLLHGDFHPGNVLSAERRPWLAIDPKPWVGDPAFDLAQILSNWLDRDAMPVAQAAASIRRRAQQLADGLSLDVDRVLRWAVVKAFGWDYGTDKVLILDRAARSG